jgi:hypothetical protein
VTYHGVLTSAPALRAAIVPARQASVVVARRAAAGGGRGSAHACGRHPWAELLKRVFAVDVLRCPGCGGRRRLIAAITQAEVNRAILAALGLPTEPPAVHPARGPPERFEGD